MRESTPQMDIFEKATPVPVVKGEDQGAIFISLKKTGGF